MVDLYVVFTEFSENRKKFHNMKQFTKNIALACTCRGTPKVAFCIFPSISQIENAERDIVVVDFIDFEKSNMQKIWELCINS